MEILKTYDIKIGDLRRIYQDNCKGNKSLFENEIRKFFITKIQELPNDTVGIVSYLNTILVAVEEDLCATSTPFLLLQDSLDLLSKDKCNLIFTYIENNLNLWKKEPMHTAGKNYLLRMCNGLLKRLSPSQDTILCGRIQIFLAKLFLISDRSGLNLNGQFNIDNVTLYENKEEYDQILEDDHCTSKLKLKVQDILKYEEFWNDWKNNGCPNFTKIPPKLEMTEDVTKKSIESTESPPSKKLKRRYKKLYLDLGNPELNALWNYEPDNIKACASKNRIFKPSLQQFMAQNSSVDRLSNNPTDTDMDSSGDYLHLAKANNQFSDQTTREWKTLRLMSRECRHFFLPYFQGSSHHHNANNSQGPNTANVTGSSAANSTNSAKTTDISNKVVSDFIDKVSNKIKLEANKNKATSMITQNITTPILKDDFKASNIAKQASKVDTVGEGKEGNNLIKEIGTDQVMGQPDDNIDKTTSNHNGIMEKKKAPESDRDMHSPNHSLSKRIKIENDDTNSNSIKKT
ncbi:unnamed protein product [Gordionus sp. m RMFG-2023]